jgi:hypothetical protein
MKNKEQKSPGGNQGNLNHSTNNTIQASLQNTQASSRTMLDYAREYVARGWSVIPLQPGSKIPAILWKKYQKDFPTDEELTNWFSGIKSYNIGIVTGQLSNLVIIDFDNKKALKEAKTRGLPGGGPIVQTSRGYHCYCEFPKDGIGNQASSQIEGLDIRGDGGYAVAPPSVHSSGNVYKWKRDPENSLPKLPSWINKNNRTENTQFIEKQITSNYGKAALKNELLLLSSATIGNRNNTLNKVAFSLSQLIESGDLNHSEVLENLKTTALSIGLKEPEISHTINSGMVGGVKHPRTRAENTRPPPNPGTPEDPLGFHFKQASEYGFTDPQWIIPGFLEEDTLSTLFGEPGAGKSFLAIDIGASIAAGIPWHGLQTKKGNVFYIAGEGKNGVMRRIKAWCQHHKVCFESLQLFVSSSPADLNNEGCAKAITKAINLSKTGDPLLVIIDTLARNFGGGNENCTHDMGTFINHLDSHIKRPFSCCVMIVHHTGHSNQSRARGSTALKGAVDSEFKISNQNNIIRMETTKMKDFEPQDTLSFKLVTEMIEIPEGDPKEISSAVLVPTDFHNPTLKKIQDLLPKDGFNQSELLKKLAKPPFNLGRDKALKLLNEGDGRFWTATKEKAKNNAKIYKSVDGFSTPIETGNQETEHINGNHQP